MPTRDDGSCCAITTRAMPSGTARRHARLRMLRARLAPLRWSSPQDCRAIGDRSLGLSDVVAGRAVLDRRLVAGLRLLPAHDVLRAAEMDRVDRADGDLVLTAADVQRVDRL